MKSRGFLAPIVVFLGLLWAGSAQAMTVLLVVVNSASLTSEETAIKTQFQTWGYTVSTVSQNATQTNIDTAVAAADVVYIPSTIQEWVLTSALRTATKGVVCGERYEDVYMGFATNLGWDYSATQMNVTNNSHYITSTFSTGLLTICGSSATCALMNTTYASGLQKLADQNSGNWGLGVMDPGATLAQTTNGNSTATARRVRLCWGGDSFSISSLNSNGLTILQRSLVWAANMTSGIASQWKLDEASGTSAADTSGNSHTGTVTGTATWTTGVIHNGFSFNGSTKIQATGLMNSAANVSVSAWANLTTADTSGAEIISLGDHFGLRLDTGGVSEVFFYNGSSYVTATIAKSYAGTGWHHFAGVFDDTNNSLKLYVDGALATTTSTAASISYSGLGANTVIGRHGNASTNYDFTGTIDDVRVYGYALSAAEVIDIYGLVGYWKLDAASGTSATDSSGNSYTGTVTGTATWVSGISGNAFSFNGSTKIQATGLTDSPANCTLAAWANLTTADTGGSEIVSLGDHVFIRVDESSTLKAYIYNGSSYVSVSYAKTFAGTGWHHFAAVFDDDNNTFTLYVDGAQVATASTASSISYSGLGSNIVIGRNGNGATDKDFTGTIDDVRIYNYPLSATAIAELYGLIGYWKLDESSGTTAADSSGMGRSGTVTGTATWSSSIINNGFSFNGSSKIQVSGLLNTPRNVTVAAWANLTTADSAGSEVVSLGDHFSLRLDESGATEVVYYNGTSWANLSFTQTVAGSGWHHYVATFDDDNDLMKLYVDGELKASTAPSSSISYAGQGSNTVIGQHGNAGTTRDFTGRIDEVRVYNRVLTNSEIIALHGLIGHWKLTESSGTTATDSTLNASNGTYLNGVSLATSSKVPGYLVQAAVFDGTNDYVSVPNESLYDTTGPLSVSVWIKVAAFDKNWQAILTKGDTSWRIARDTTTNTITFGNQGLTTYKVTTVTSVNDGKWHHLVGVYDGSNLKIYLDGALNATATTSGTPSTNSYVVYIGENSEITGRQFTGAIYDARFYNRAITSEEVTQLYGSGFTGVIITKWVESQ
jgi:Concanavalin A-like lectin/glucanases superfamily